MPFQVLVTDAAARDLEDLYNHVRRRDGSERAGHLLKQLEELLSSLSDSPNRGSYPKELQALGIQEYREDFFRPYRVSYRTVEDRADILLLADGRRDLQSLLERRLLEA